MGKDIKQIGNFTPFMDCVALFKRNDSPLGPIYLGLNLIKDVLVNNVRLILSLIDQYILTPDCPPIPSQTAWRTQVKS